VEHQLAGDIRRCAAKSPHQPPVQEQNEGGLPVKATLIIAQFTACQQQRCSECYRSRAGNFGASTPASSSAATGTPA
jgi:hypothetical protein